MKDLSLGELFCEVLGGALAMLLCVAVLDRVGVVSIPTLVQPALQHLTLTDVTTGAILSYLVGLLVDSIGLAVGELGLDRLLRPDEMGYPTRPVPEYWKTAPDHVFKYRERQWAFFSAYRNALILLAVSLCVVPSVVGKYLGNGWGYASAAGMVVLGVALWIAARACIGLYSRIPHFFAVVASATPPAGGTTPAPVPSAGATAPEPALPTGSGGATPSGTGK